MVLLTDPNPLKKRNNIHITTYYTVYPTYDIINNFEKSSTSIKNVPNQNHYSHICSPLGNPGRRSQTIDPLR
jgi:hypothetical protein